jgi:hypothetical protein
MIIYFQDSKIFQKKRYHDRVFTANTFTKAEGQVTDRLAQRLDLDGLIEREPVILEKFQNSANTQPQIAKSAHLSLDTGMINDSSSISNKA